MTGAAALLPESDVLDFLRKRHNLLDGVVFSGGEPTLQPDLAEAWFSRAICAYHTGDYVTAWRALDRCRAAGGQPDPRFLQDLRAKSATGQPSQPKRPTAADGLRE